MRTKGLPVTSTAHKNWKRDQFQRSMDRFLHQRSSEIKEYFDDRHRRSHKPNHKNYFGWMNEAPWDLYRFKTAEEMETEFGSDWRSSLWSDFTWPLTYDKFLGQSAKELVDSQGVFRVMEVKCPASMFTVK